MIVQDYAYSPFGAPVQAMGGQANPLQYTGEQWDEATGLLYLRARWYDPDTGRFLTPDPFPCFAAYPPSLNAYVYAFNDPISLTDPSGEFPVLAAGLYAAGYVGYDQADRRVKSGVGRVALDVVGFMTGYENIQQDWGIITNSCASILCKISAVGDLTLNATFGVSMFSGIGNIPKATSAAKQLIKKGSFGEATLKWGDDFFRPLGKSVINAPRSGAGGFSRLRQLGNIAHEFTHYQQEFLVGQRTSQLVTKPLQRLSVWLTPARNVREIHRLPLTFLYVLNPVEVHAAASGLASPSNWGLLALNRLTQHYGYDLLVESGGICEDK